MTTEQRADLRYLIHSLYDKIHEELNDIGETYQYFRAEDISTFIYRINQIIDNMRIIGTVLDVTPAEEHTTSAGKTFKKMQVIIRQDAEQHADTVAINVMNRDIETFDLKIGDRCKVMYDVTAKKSPEGKYYNDLYAWRITRLDD